MPITGIESTYSGYQRPPENEPQPDSRRNNRSFEDALFATRDRAGSDEEARERLAALRLQTDISLRIAQEERRTQTREYLTPVIYEKQRAYARTDIDLQIDLQQARLFSLVS